MDGTAGADGGFDWLLGVLHEVAHAQAGPRAACLFLPDGADADGHLDLCPAMDDAAAAGLLEALEDAGLTVAELLEPVRLFFPALGPHQHAVALPLAREGATRGVLVVAGPVPPLGGAALGRVVDLAAGGLGWVSAAQERSARLHAESAEAERLAGELEAARVLLDLQSSLVAARSTAEVAIALATWLDAPVAVQLPNLIIAEAAGAGARELALSPNRSAKEKAVLSGPSTALPVLPPAGRTPARVVAPIVAGDGAAAGFLVAAVGHRGAAVTARALSLSRGLIAYQLSVRQELDRSVVTLRQSLLADLLAGCVGAGVADGAVNAAAKLGHDLAAAHLTLAVGCRDAAVPDGTADRLVRLVEQAAAQASAAAAAPLVGFVEGTVVALVPEPVPAGWAALAAAVQAEAAAEGIDVVAGIGPVAEAPAALPGALRRARWAVQILRTTPTEDGRGSAVAHFDDLGVYGLLFDHSRAGDLADFARRRIGLLVEYDRKHRSELVETLRQLFRRRSLAEAASALHIHISTLKYRVSRIEEILGVSLECWDTVFHLELALRILAVTDRVAGGPPVAPAVQPSRRPPAAARRAR